ncbi:MAG: hypothetical protein AAF456_17180 [Planctomycetota bacterium]
MTTVRKAGIRIFHRYFSGSGVFLFVMMCAQTAFAQSSLESTPGFPKVIEAHVIVGTEVIARPIEDRDSEVQLRILETYAHGTDFRYDIEYTAYVPGEHDLAEYLKRKDGSDIPIEPINVMIKTVLPDGQVEPNERPQKDAAFRSFYLATLVVGGAVWLLGLFAILFAGRGKTRHPSHEQKMLTVADRLRPMVEKAKAGDLSSHEQAELERLLTAFWRKKLRLSHLTADQLIVNLRQHEQAGPLLHQLELWLHAPASDGEVNIAALMEPYKEMSGHEI